MSDDIDINSELLSRIASKFADMEYELELEKAHTESLEFYNATLRGQITKLRKQLAQAKGEM